jgi:hypothetical protein
MLALIKQRGNMINLISLLDNCGICLTDYKIHFATENNTSPLDAYFRGVFKEWQEEQNGPNFKCKIVIGLIQLNKIDQWLYAGSYKVLGVTKGTKPKYLYQTELIPGQADLIGRIIVKYKKNYRNSYILAKTCSHSLEVSEFRPLKLMVEEFPGYNNIQIPYSKLKLIVEHEEPTWRSALSSVNGVYLIADLFNGKKYVGSAKGEDGIWSRWCSYIRNGHGQNIELKELLEKEGSQYSSNFQFTLLELIDKNNTDEFIIGRENHWKEALLTRKHGYNSN